MDLKKNLTLCEKADTARRASAPPACQWDAENRMVSVDSGSTATQNYNALGQRVERFLTSGSWTFDYLFSQSGEELGLYSAGTAAWFDQNVPMAGRVLVMYGSPSRFLHANKLGTTTVTTDQTGSELQDELFYPWGQDWTRAGQPYVMHFAGMQGFENPGLVYPTDFRRYNPALGRWMSPDPLAGDVSNPQSLNRYAYVLNNPVSNTDPSGLDTCTNPEDGTSVDCITSESWAPTPPDNVGLLPSQAAAIPGGGGSSGGGGGGKAANNGTPQQPTRTQERLERLKNCGLGYYGIDPVSAAGLSSDAKWGLIAAAAGGVPKSVAARFGVRVIMLPGSSEFTSLLSIISAAAGGGPLRTVANFGSKWAGPIAIAPAVIDAAAIGICTATD